MKGLVALVAGLLFGAGLALGGMTNPAKVLNFLDFAGAWDPSLACVMGGALAVSAVASAWARRRGASWLGGPLTLPPSTGVDGRLLGGALLFGLGWGLVGLCPGPALAALVTGAREVLLFVAAMLAGILLYTRLPTRSAAPQGGKP